MPNRREFLSTAGLCTAVIMAPRWAFGLAAPRPSDKLTVACIGVGSQGLRLMMDLLRMPEVQVVAVCDVNRQSSDYLDGGPNELRDKVRRLLQHPVGVRPVWPCGRPRSCAIHREHVLRWRHR